MDLVAEDCRHLQHRIVHGDAIDALDTVPDESCRLVISSPPYNLGKEYERGERQSLQDQLALIRPILEKSVSKITADGHLCWQIGNHVRKGEIFPLDIFYYQAIIELGLKLRNRIIWQFNFGQNLNKRFSGRYETLLWFTKSDNYLFQLEEVRIPQLYPGKRHPNSRKSRAGLPSGNPRGKNPTDYWVFDPAAAFRDDPVWNIPNVKAAHPEKTVHPCQFPSELVERCVLALTAVGDTVLDPFLGAGTSVIAAAKHGRRGVGIDKSEDYVGLARRRLEALQTGTLTTRPIGKPIRTPKAGERVAKVPTEWLNED